MKNTLKTLLKIFIRKGFLIGFLKNTNRFYKQKKVLAQTKNLNTPNLIVFLINGASEIGGQEQISGGIMSIDSIYQETLKLKALHDSEVIMLTSKSAFLITQFSTFPSNSEIFHFDLLKKFKRLNKLILHIPEYKFNKNEILNIAKHLNLNLNQIHANILNQSVQLMPKPDQIKELAHLGVNITQTTAHEKYSTPEMRDYYGVPLHLLSVYARPERYNFTNFSNKKNIILVSPDEHDQKDQILKNLSLVLPEYEIIIIDNYKYTDYLELIETSKYMITFGEGLDFYLIETFFSGGIAFSVYNDVFFTEDFKNAPYLAKTFNGFSDFVINIIKNEKTISAELIKTGFSDCEKIYSGDKYTSNIKEFYLKNYTLA